MDNPALLFVVVFIAGILAGSALFVIGYISARKAIIDDRAEQGQGKGSR